MTAHTPGPWLLVEQGDANEYAILTPDKKDWVVAFRLNAGLPVYTQERANAKLIASAPELIDALTAVLRSFESCCPERYFSDDNVAIAEDVIKKATT
jgi:hypothetical protein